MQLLDCFTELIAYTSYLLQSVTSARTSYEQVKTDISALITSGENTFHNSRLPQEDFDLARFAVFAWIDEAILSSNWQEKDKWQSEQLQRIYYQTTAAGELFFDKLNQLGPQQNQVREVYYLCLSLGFTGRYCNPGDEFLLEQLKNSNLKVLGGTSDIRTLEEKTLFPEAYLLGKTKKARSSKNSPFSLGLILGGTVPILLYILLFFVYRFVLGNVGENFLSSVL